MPASSASRAPVARPKRSLHVVLAQVRDDPRAETQERHCFRQATGLGREEMECVNLVAEPKVTWQRIRAADALLIGGAGAHSATRDYPFTGPLEETTARAIEEGMPVFGSCWGHHFLARLLGGELVTDPEAEEVGTFDVTLTAEGRRDPLFDGFPPSFTAQLGHHDRVSRLPPGAEELAFSALCRNQALRLPGRPVYGTQFHSEMNEAQIRARLEMYRENYLGERAEEIVSSCRPSPWADRLLGRFVERYVRSGRPAAS